MISIVVLFLLALTCGWLLWRYAPERSWLIVRFLARVSAFACWLYAFILMFSLFDQRPWMIARLSGETVPFWVYPPLVWGVWGGWTWLHVSDWLSGRRGVGDAG